MFVIRNQDGEYLSYDALGLFWFRGPHLVYYFETQDEIAALKEAMPNLFAKQSTKIGEMVFVESR